VCHVPGALGGIFGGNKLESGGTGAFSLVPPAFGGRYTVKQGQPGTLNYWLTVTQKQQSPARRQASQPP